MRNGWARVLAGHRGRHRSARRPRRRRHRPERRYSAGGCADRGRRLVRPSKACRGRSRWRRYAARWPRCPGRRARRRGIVYGHGCYLLARGDEAIVGSTMEYVGFRPEVTLGRTRAHLRGGRGALPDARSRRRQAHVGRPPARDARRAPDHRRRSRGSPACGTPRATGETASCYRLASERTNVALVFPPPFSARPRLATNWASHSPHHAIVTVEAVSGASQRQRARLRTSTSRGRWVASRPRGR